MEPIETSLSLTSEPRVGTEHLGTEAGQDYIHQWRKHQQKVRRVREEKDKQINKAVSQQRQDVTSSQQINLGINTQSFNLQRLKLVLNTFAILESMSSENI